MVKLDHIHQRLKKVKALLPANLKTLRQILMGKWVKYLQSHPGSVGIQSDNYRVPVMAYADKLFWISSSNSLRTMEITELVGQRICYILLNERKVEW